MLLIHSSADGNLGCFHILAIMSNTAVDMYMQVLCGHICLFFLSIYLEVEFLEDIHF